MQRVARRVAEVEARELADRLEQQPGESVSVRLVTFGVRLHLAPTVISHFGDICVSRFVTVHGWFAHNVHDMRMVSSGMDEPPV